MTIEQQLARLEEIVEQLEGEHVDLAKALALFEEGVGHLRAAAGSLAEAEGRVKQLTELANGTFRVEDLDDDE